MIFLITHIYITFAMTENSKILLQPSILSNSIGMVVTSNVCIDLNFHILNFQANAVRVQGASGAVTSIMLLNIFLHPKQIIFFQMFIPMPAALLVSYLSSLIYAIYL